MSTISLDMLRRMIDSKKQELSCVQDKLKRAIKARREGSNNPSFKELARREAIIAGHVRRLIIELSELRQQYRIRCIQIFAKKFAVAIYAIVPSKK